MTVTRRQSGVVATALFTIGVGVNLAGVVRHLGDPVAVGVIAVNLAWLLSEAPVTFRRTAAPPREIGTLIGYGLARMTMVGCAVLGPLRSLWLPALVLMIAGIALRLVSMRVLGRSYSHHVVRSDDHVIVRTGPYRLVRHPAYAGMLLGNAGLVLCFANWAAVVAWLALAVAIGWRIHTEEREMLVIPAYRRYAVGRPRLVPGMW
jgi:protein-S-isoprenylcysteine O-methyltransferase Ste14